MTALSKLRHDWLATALNDFHKVGYAVIADVVTPQMIEKTKIAMYGVQRKILADVGLEKLRVAGECGVLRLMIKYDPFFMTFLELPELLQFVDAAISSTAILHLQNGFILPSFEPGAMPRVFQNRFHMDFPRVLNGYLMSVNAFFAVSEFTSTSGSTLVVPGTQQRMEAPTEDYMRKNAIPVECPAGSMILFDSTLWHAAGENTSGADRLAINQQFTRSYIKQQIDYVRAIGPQQVQQYGPRTQQLLGYYTRVVTSLDEYYQPEDKRLYRKGQG